MLEQILTVSFMTAFLAAAVRLAVPLMYGGIGEIIAEKSGILNIGMEGVMLSGAFFSFAGAWFSKSLMVGLLCGILGGLAVSLLHGLLSITLIQNQSVSGLAINMLMLGVTSFLYKLMSNGQSYQQLETFQSIALPGLSSIPLIGPAFFNCDILTYILYIFLILTWLFYKKTNLGLSFAAVGEHPRAAESAGIHVNQYRWIVMIFNGVLGGIGGAYLVLVQLARLHRKHDFRTRLYCACHCYFRSLYTIWHVWRSTFIWRSKCPSDSSSDNRCIHFTFFTGNSAICIDSDRDAWCHRQEQ